MSNSAARIVLRVQAANGEPRSNAFDALILTTNRALREEVAPSHLTGMAVPFERELSDVDTTVIVRSNDTDLSLISECDVFGADGRRRVYGRSGKNVSVFMCSSAGIMVTGLPAPASGSEPPAA
jgi:hypothetical protein